MGLLWDVTVRLLDEAKGKRRFAVQWGGGLFDDGRAPEDSLSSGDSDARYFEVMDETRITIHEGHYENCLNYELQPPTGLKIEDFDVELVGKAVKLMTILDVERDMYRSQSFSEDAG